MLENEGECALGKLYTDHAKARFILFILMQHTILVPSLCTTVVGELERYFNPFHNRKSLFLSMLVGRSTLY